MMVWILTKSVNDYNQYGDYYIEAFKNKPTREQLRACEVPDDDIEQLLEKGSSTHKGPYDEYTLEQVQPK
jgi:hypothetical protein